MTRRPPKSQRTDPPFPDTTLCRSPSLSGPAPCPAPARRTARRPPRRRVHSRGSRRRLRRSHNSADPYATVQGVYRSCLRPPGTRSEEHTSELQSLMRISYAVFCLKKKKTRNNTSQKTPHKTNNDISSLTNTTPRHTTTQ